MLSVDCSCGNRLIELPHRSCQQDCAARAAGPISVAMGSWPPDLICAEFVRFTPDRDRQKRHASLPICANSHGRPAPPSRYGDEMSASSIKDQRTVALPVRLDAVSLIAEMSNPARVAAGQMFHARILVWQRVLAGSIAYCPNSNKFDRPFRYPVGLKTKSSKSALATARVRRCCGPRAPAEKQSHGRRRLTGSIAQLFCNAQMLLYCA